MAADAEKWWKLQQQRLLTFHPSSRSADNFPLPWEAAGCTAWCTAAAGFIYSSESSALRCEGCRRSVLDITAPVDLLALHQAVDVEGRCPYLSFCRRNSSPLSPVNAAAATEEGESTVFGAATVRASDSQRRNASPMPSGAEGDTWQRKYQSYLKHRAKAEAKLAAADLKRLPKDPTNELYRMKTFERNRRHLTPEISFRCLPAHGFFVRDSAEGKEICCAFCGCSVMVKDQLSDADVLKSHKSSPTECPFIRGKPCLNKPYMLDLWEDSEDEEEELLGFGIAGPRHSEPGLAVQDRRRATYLTRPHNYEVVIEGLCESGFFYIGHGVSVCFSCKLSVDNWSVAEDPWQRHARASPRCQFLLDQKGAEYISQVIEQFGRYVPPAQQPTINSVTTRMLRPRLDTEVVQRAFALGLDRQIVRNVLIRNIKNGNQDFHSVADLVRECQKSSAPENELADTNATPPLPTVVDEPERRTQDQQQYQLALFDGSEIDINNNAIIAPSYQGLSEDQRETNHNSQTSCGVIQGSNRERNGSDTNIPTLAKEVKARLICSVCLSEPVGIVFLPCGHFVCCVACSAAMLECPICRNTVMGTVRAYIPQGITHPSLSHTPLSKSCFSQ